MLECDSNQNYPGNINRTLMLSAGCSYNGSDVLTADIAADSDLRAGAACLWFPLPVAVPLQRQA